MTADSNGNRIWVKIAIALLPMAIAGLVGYGALKARVDGIDRALLEKANRETVAAQYESLLREIQSVKQLIERRP